MLLVGRLKLLMQAGIRLDKEHILSGGYVDGS
jgi:hypothetical protein